MTIGMSASITRVISRTLPLMTRSRSMGSAQNRMLVIITGIIGSHCHMPSRRSSLRIRGILTRSVRLNAMPSRMFSRNDISPARNEKASS